MRLDGCDAYCFALHEEDGRAELTWRRLRIASGVDGRGTVLERPMTLAALEKPKEEGMEGEMLHDSQQCSSNVLACYEAGPISVRLAEFNWNDQEPFLDRDHGNSIRLRLYPDNVALRGQIDGSNWSGFGALTLLPDGSEIKAVGPKGRATVLTCCLQDEWIQDVVHEKLSLRAIDPATCLNIGSTGAKSSLTRIARELANPGLASDSLIEGCLQTAIVELVRDVCCESDKTNPNGRLSQRDLTRIREMIEELEPLRPSLSVLAAKIGVSTSHFRHLFRSAAGCSFQEYMIRLRIEKAQRLLADRSCSMKLAAHRLGFSSPSAFSFAFKRSTGMRPTTYKQMIRS